MVATGSSSSTTSLKKNKDKGKQRDTGERGVERVEDGVGGALVGGGARSVRSGTTTKNGGKNGGGGRWWDVSVGSDWWYGTGWLVVVMLVGGVEAVLGGSVVGSM